MFTDDEPVHPTVAVDQSTDDDGRPIDCLTAPVDLLTDDESIDRPIDRLAVLWSDLFVDDKSIDRSSNSSGG
jgi:hypothetical protein